MTGILNVTNQDIGRIPGGTDVPVTVKVHEQQKVGVPPVMPGFDKPKEKSSTENLNLGDSPENAGVTRPYWDTKTMSQGSGKGPQVGPTYDSLI